MTNKAKPTTTGTEKKLTAREDKMITQYLNSLVFNDQGRDVGDILTLVDNPFIDSPTNDVVSLLFCRFFENTDAHPGLAIFSFLSMLSAWCVQNKATCLVPMTSTPAELAVWLMLLAGTGENKSLTTRILSNSLPKNLATGRPIVESNFIQPVSNKSLFEQIRDLPDHRGFWKQDEGGQFIRQLDNLNGPHAQTKQSLLLLKDNDPVPYAVGGRKEVVENAVLVVLMINTMESMVGAVSPASMYDGMFRRFTVASAVREENDGGIEFEKAALYNLLTVNDNALSKEMEAVFSQPIQNAAFTFSPPCVSLYQKTFEVFWTRQFKRFLLGQKTYFRTYMMESWKYAVFHHIIHKKQGHVVDEYSLQWGLKVSMYMLNSLQTFIAKQTKTTDVVRQKDFLESFQNFIKVNEDKPGLMRAVCRKFNMKTETVCGNLAALKELNPKFQTKLLAQMEKKFTKANEDY